MSEDRVRERAIDDLDLRRFAKVFLSPYQPEDSLEYMAERFVTLKQGEERENCRKTIEELMSDSSLRQQAAEFVEEDYALKSWIAKRDKIVGSSKIGRTLVEMIIWLNRGKLKELIRVDYQLLKSCCALVKRAQEIEGESAIMQGIRELSLNIAQNKDYQTAKEAVETMENFGEAGLRVKYNYFNTVTGLGYLKFSPNERWKNLLGWYIYEAGNKIGYLLSLGLKGLFPSRKEIFLVQALEFLVEQNLPLIQELLEYRKLIDFFLGAARYVDRMKLSGIPLVFPDFSRKEGFLIKELYNPLLLLQSDIEERGDIIANDAESSPEQNVAIITGPNNTGKTVYVKSIGLAYVLAQNGFPIPASEAEICELQDVYTHFVHPEDIALGEGSFLDELRRIGEMLQSATSKSLLIIDEPIKGSSPEDAEKISLRIIRGLLLLKAPVFLTTHLHSVAGEASNWKGVKALQTGVNLKEKKIQPTYKIKPGKAEKSYGIEIADELGFTLEGILKTVEEKS